MLLQVIAGLFVFEFVKSKDIEIYLYSLYGVFGICYILSLLVIFPSLRISGLPDCRIFKILWRLGTRSQSTTIIHFFNNRFSFYILNYFFSVSEVGIYSIAVALVEVVFLIGNSISLMLYTNVANTSSPAKALSTTKTYFILSLLSTGLALFILILLPTEWYDIIFGHGFGQARLIVFYLRPGAWLLNVYFVSSSYFSGTGRYKYNIHASALGFIVMLIGSMQLVPYENIISAAVVTSAASAVTALYSLYVFRMYYVRTVPPENVY